MSPVVSKKMPLLTVAVSDTAHCPCPRLHRFRPASHKSATRAVFMKKGNPARSQIPFNYSNGAEGGTRTPTGFPTTPQIREDGLRPQIRGLLHRTYRDNRHCNPE